MHEFGSNTKQRQTECTKSEGPPSDQSTLEPVATFLPKGKACQLIRAPLRPWPPSSPKGRKACQLERENLGLWPPLFSQDRLLLLSLFTKSHCEKILALVHLLRLLQLCCFVLLPNFQSPSWHHCSFLCLQ